MNAGYVSLMTVHLAKGLEFPCVFIAGVEEGIFPHSRSLIESMALEEERRLMYVAITRAKEQLYISRAFERYTFGNYSANPKSRFIKEIPEEYLDATQCEQRRQTNMSIFGSGGSNFLGMQSLFSSTASGTANANIQAKISAKKHQASDFALGDRIRHPQYGTGTIIALNDTIADIAFSGMGIKKMNIEIAPIEKIA